MAEDDVEAPDVELPPENEAEPDDEQDQRDADSPDATEDEPKGDAKRVRDAQEALRKANEKNARLAERLAKLEGVVETAIKPKQEEVESGPKPFDYLNDEGLAATIFDDGTKPIELIKRVVSDIFGTLEMRDRALLSRINDATPEAREIKEEVDALAKDPEFRGWSREALAVVARKMRSGGDTPRVRPGPGSRKAPMSREQGELNDTVEGYMKMIGYDKE